MKSKKLELNNIDAYISQFPHDIQVILTNIRQTIRNIAPMAIEKISYGIPTFKLKNNLVHFAAFKNHIGLYPSPKCIEKFKSKLEAYETSKGTIRFPLKKPILYDLIAEIVVDHVAELKSK